MKPGSPCPWPPPATVYGIVQQNGCKIHVRSEPGLRSLFMSGYTAGIIAQRSVLDEDTDFIQTPFDNEVLLKTVLGILDGA